MRPKYGNVGGREGPTLSYTVGEHPRILPESHGKSIFCRKSFPGTGKGWKSNVPPLTVCRSEGAQDKFNHVRGEVLLSFTMDLTSETLTNIPNVTEPRRVPLLPMNCLTLLLLALQFLEPHSSIWSWCDNKFVWSIEVFGLHRCLMYTGVSSTRLSHLYRCVVYTGVSSTQLSHLYRCVIYTGVRSTFFHLHVKMNLVYTSVSSIQVSDVYRCLTYTGVLSISFWYLQVSPLYRCLMHTGV